MGFASMFMITFGSKVFNYKTFSESVYTLLLALLGDADLSRRCVKNGSGPILTILSLISSFLYITFLYKWINMMIYIMLYTSIYIS